MRLFLVARWLLASPSSSSSTALAVCLSVCLLAALRMTQVLSAMPTRFHSHSKFPLRLRSPDPTPTEDGRRGQGERPRPSSLAFSECANSGMMPTGFISAARAGRGGRGAGGEEGGGGKDGKSRRVLAEVARCRASLPRSRRSVGSQLLARVEVLVGERAGLRTEGFSCCRLPVSRSRRRGAKPKTIRPLS